MEKRGKNGAGYKVFDGSVGQGRAKALPIAGRSLAKSGLAVFSLADSSQESKPGILHTIERTSGHHGKFLPGRERWQFSGVLQTQKIRQGVDKDGHSMCPQLSP